jgi:MFS family permease
VIVFALTSALCGLTPKGSLAETWLIVFRAIQGVGGAIMFPAALAIAVQTFRHGLPHAQASTEASRIAQDKSGTHVGAIPHFVQLDFAFAIRSVL